MAPPRVAPVSRPAVVRVSRPALTVAGAPGPSHLGTGEGHGQKICFGSTDSLTRSSSAPLLAQSIQIRLRQIFGRHDDPEPHLGVEAEEPRLREPGNV